MVTELLPVALIYCCEYSNQNYTDAKSDYSLEFFWVEKAI